MTTIAEEARVIPSEPVIEELSLREARGRGLLATITAAHFSHHVTNSLLNPLLPLIRDADISFGNLECCLATGGKPVPKMYNFRGRPSNALALREAGFKIVSLANNHAWDFGRDALEETVQRVFGVEGEVLLDAQDRQTVVDGTGHGTPGEQPRPCSGPLDVA